MLSDVLWGRGHTRKPSALLPPCTEVLGPEDGTCLSPGTKRKRAVVKGTGLPGCLQRIQAGEKGSGATLRVWAWSRAGHQPLGL